MLTYRVITSHCECEQTLLLFRSFVIIYEVIHILIEDTSIIKICLCISNCKQKTFIYRTLPCPKITFIKEVCDYQLLLLTHYSLQHTYSLIFDMLSKLHTSFHTQSNTIHNIGYSRPHKETFSIISNDGEPKLYK